MSQVCDGTPNCPDNSDEMSCCGSQGWHQCISGPSPSYYSLIHTGTTTCVPPHKVCDGIPHCADHTDETDEACAKRYAQTQYPQQESQGYVLITAFITAGFLIIVGFGIYRWRTTKSKGDNGVQDGDPARDPLSPKLFANCGNAGCGSKGYPGTGGHSCVLMSTLNR